MSDGQYFSASYDRTARILSAVSGGVILAAAVGGAVAVPGAVGSILFGAGALTLLLAYAFSPKGYIVSEGAITVKRLIGDVRVPLGGLRERRAAVREDFRGCIRLFGNGGLFGYYGLYRTSKLGRCRWYLTNRSKAVVVTARQTALFSPDDVEGFLAALPKTALVSGAPEPFAGMLSATASPDWAGRILGAVVGVAALGLAGAAMLYAPGPPAYTLTREALTIHDRFYPVTVPAESVEVERIQVVDLSQDSSWRATRRTNGFGNPHYHSGWFRVANGQTVRMYWADGQRLVLLPGRGTGATVLYEARDPERFVSQVRREWTRGS